MDQHSRKFVMTYSLLPYILLIYVCYLYLNKTAIITKQPTMITERAPELDTYIPAMIPECVNTDVYDVYQNSKYNVNISRGHHYHSVKLNESEIRNDFVYQMTKTNIFMNHEMFDYFIANRWVCDTRRPRVVVAIQMSVRERCMRDAVRDTWASKRIQEEEQVVVLFFLAMSTNATLMGEVYRESEEHGDIVVDSYTDSLHNLSLKEVSIVKWVSRYCRHVEYMIHSDGDTYMHLPNINRWIRNEVRTRKLKKARTIYSTHKARKSPYEAFCRMNNFYGIIRTRGSKYFMDFDQIEANRTRFPPFCNGCWYMTDVPTVSALYRATINSGYVWIPDAFLLGYIMKKIEGKFNDLTKDKRFAYNQARIELRMPELLVACQLYPKHLYVLHHILQGDINNTTYTLSFPRV